MLYHRIRPLPRSNDRNAQPTVRALQNELLMPPNPQVVAHCPDQDEPPDNHENISCEIRPTEFIAVPASVHVVRVEIVRVRVRRRRILTPIPAHVPMHSPASARRRGLDGETVLNERDAEACEGAVLGCVRRVQEVSEEEADDREDHGDHAVPHEAEEGADGHAVDEDVVGTAEAGCEDGRFPVWWGLVGRCLFVGLERC